MDFAIGLSSSPCVLNGRSNFWLDMEGEGSNPRGTSNWKEEWSFWHVIVLTFRRWREASKEVRDSKLGQQGVPGRYCISDMAFPCRNTET